jgi:hypothetical protein
MACIASHAQSNIEIGLAIAQAVSRRLQVMWDLWWTKWHWGRSSGAGTTGQTVAAVPSGLSLTP